MSLRSKVILGPIDKYKYYSKHSILFQYSHLMIVDRFPWKLLIHILLIILSSAQVLILVDRTGDYSRIQEVQWIHIFLNGSVSFMIGMIQFVQQDIQTEGLTSRYMYIYDLHTLSDFVNQSVQSYYNIESKDTIEEYQLM